MSYISFGILAAVMDAFELSCHFPAPASRLYREWLNSATHSAFTGGPAAIEGVVDSSYTAWDGYITGRILELEENKRILKSWRTTEFESGHEDSMLELEFTDTANGCRLHLKHWNIPDGQSARYLKGWDEFYFQPMRKYFSPA